MPFWNILIVPPLFVLYVLYIRFYKDPDVIIYKPDDSGIYLRRWWIVPRNKFGFNVYLHHFMSSDEDRATHNHPWIFNISILLSGSYLEHVPRDIEKFKKHESREIVVLKRGIGSIIYRNVDSIHRIELIDNKPIWTLFITGPVVQDWGFYCNKFFRSNEEFLTKYNSDGQVISIKGRGCD